MNSDTLSSNIVLRTLKKKKVGHVFLPPRVNVKIDEPQVQLNACRLRLLFLAVMIKETGSVPLHLGQQ